MFEPLEDFSTDFASDSAGSPVSPISPVLAASPFAIPTSDDWVTWDAIEHSPEPEDFLKSEPIQGFAFSFPQPQTGAMSPAINPMDLSIPLPTDFGMGTEGTNNNAPLFQAAQPILPSSMPMEQPLQPAPVQHQLPSQAPRRPSLKRKSSTSSESQDEQQLSPKRTAPSPPQQQQQRRGSTDNTKKDAKDQAPKKTAHNMIEKRYRTNLNDKIAQLRDSVPALRVVAQRLEHPSWDEDGENDEAVNNGSLAPAAKLNKATILSKATEYIAQLERRNRGLETENHALRGRMEGLEMMLMSRGGGNGVWN